MTIPEESSRYFGLYSVENIYPRNLAMPIWHWGKFYERLIRTIIGGTWKNDENADEVKAINYWWGMSAEAVDVIYSQSLPIGTKRLVELLKQAIHKEEFNPFAGILYSQTGVVQGHPDKSLSAQEIITMDWLAENVLGTIPNPIDLQDAAKPVISQQGLETVER